MVRAMRLKASMYRSVQFARHFWRRGDEGKVGDKQWDSKRRQAWFEWGWRINKPAEMAPWSSWWF